MNTDRWLYALQVLLFVTAPAYIVVATLPWPDDDHTVWEHTYDDGSIVVSKELEEEDPVFVSVVFWIMMLGLTLTQIGIAACLFCLRRIGILMRQQAVGGSDDVLS